MEALYLDTHIIAWLYAGEKKFNIRTNQLLNSSQLYISPIVELELQYLYEIKRIKAKAKTIIEILEKQIGLRKCNYDFQNIITEAMKINWTRNVFDRIIVAQASIGNHKLLTKDKNILKHYKHAIWD
jgi:PIN domain nuclease of toxin-antitoxin system